MALNIATRGAVSTATQSTLVKRQVEEEVYRLRANVAAFVNLLRLTTHEREAKAQGRKSTSKIINCTNPKFEWLEQDVGTPVAVTQAAYAAGDTDIVVDESDYFTAGDVLHVVSTGEQLLVTVVTTGTDTLTVTRSYGTIAAAAIASGASIVLLGNCFEEGSAATTPKAFATGEAYNYTQIFKDAVDITRTAEQTQHYGSVNDLKKRRRDVWDQFIQARARQYWFGQRNIDVTGTNPKRITGGVNEFLTGGNLQACAGSLTYTKFMDFSEMVYAYGGDEKTLFVDSVLLKAIQNEVLSKTQYQIEGQKQFGLKIMKLVTPFGDMGIVHDRTLGYFRSGNNGLGFALELGLIDEMVMQPDSWEANVQVPGVDGKKDQVLGEAGIKIRLPLRHGKITL
ncbi:MAG: DUF5309 domain-containing protein [Candidatus Riflebacteria bacterium]|nr:DUF5309 domain-containing protein [Candidatus Riflebacteria bacterium]